MMASLNQSSAGSSGCSTLGIAVESTIYPPSLKATEQQSRVLFRTDAQPDPAPFGHDALPGDEILDSPDAAAGARRADLDVAEVEPELAWPGLAQRDRDRHRIVADGRFL